MYRRGHERLVHLQTAPTAEGLRKFSVKGPGNMKSLRRGFSPFTCGPTEGACWLQEGPVAGAGLHVGSTCGLCVGATGGV